MPETQIDIEFGDVPVAYQAMLRDILSKARMFLENGESLTTVVFLCSSATKTMHIVQLSHKTPEEKDRNVALVRAFAQDTGADAAILVSEIWGLSVKDIGAAATILKEYGSIAAYPGHVDLAMFILETPSGFWSGQTELKATQKNGKSGRTFRKLQFIRPTEVHGWLANLLPAAQDKDSLH